MSLLSWKLRREMGRIRQQLQAIPEFFFEPWQRKRHDTQRVSMLQAVEGAIPGRPKVALLLLYQPAGVSDATRWTCEHLASKGYAPLIVSNAPLSSADRQLLSPWVWRMTERPNFGYDFGGYRDGIWLLKQWRVEPDVLIILNDSIWFPMQGSETLIDRMEACPAQFVGALQLDPLRQSDNVPAKKRPFFGSFFVMAQHGAWQHPAFQRFWVDYRITSNKHKTIRRGERGLSHTLMDAGLRCEAMFTRTALDSHVRSLGSPALRDLLNDLVTIDDRLESSLADCRKSYQDSASWRARAIELTLAITEKQNVLATAPITSMKVFQVPYLKKSKDWNNLNALKLIRERVNEGALPAPHPSIMDALGRLLD
ncbi:MAG: hypothetical protein DCF26_22585 [Burkholderiales bacterium]|nr:MAG: hypothetical protein DCF26_22585 [Burkholderiales bacterium]